MAAPRKRETASDRILQKIDGLHEHLQVIRNTPTAAVLSVSGDVPFWQTNLFDVATPDATDPEAAPLLLVEVGDWCLKLSKRTAPMPFSRRHIDADEVFFIHRGRARFETELGVLDAPEGRFIFIGRGVGYRVIPESDDLIALVLESEASLSLSGVFRAAKVATIDPQFPGLGPVGEAHTAWEERLVTRHWSAKVMRGYQPTEVMQVVGDAKFVFAVDLDDIPVFLPESTVPGLPFSVFKNDTMSWEVTKRPGALPFYHRNLKESEIEFCHAGCADQDTELGYVAAPVGSFYNLPLGIEHAPCNRNVEPTPINLIWSARGVVQVNEDILPADGVGKTGN